MYKKLIALALSLSLCFGVFSVSAAGINQLSSSQQVSSDTPTTGVPSTDPHHASGLYNSEKTQSSGKMFAMATGLLASESLDVYDDGNCALRLEGRTIGTEVLSKIGFQNITLQRWENGQWNNVKVWSTYKYNCATYPYEYSTTVDGGYDYRYVATHYAEKDWLIFPSTETYYNETSYLYVG